MADILVKVFSHCPSKEIWHLYWLVYSTQTIRVWDCFSLFTSGFCQNLFRNRRISSTLSFYMGLSGSGEITKLQSI